MLFFRRWMGCRYSIPVRTSLMNQPNTLVVDIAVLKPDGACVNFLRQ